MAALEIALDDEDEVFMDQFHDVDWLDDVEDFKCTRCSKVLVQHFVANCAHKFCANCKRLLDDGSEKWKCPKCQLFIVEIIRQDLQFKDRVRRLRLHCPNRKYGCPHICTFKDLKEHFERCKATRERALPVPCKRDLTVEQLERMFSMEMQVMKREMLEMQQKVIEVEHRYDTRDAEEKGLRESSWEMSVEVNEMKQRMTKIEKNQQDAKGKLRAKLSYVNDRINGVKSDLIVETTRLKADVFQLLQKQEIKSDAKASPEENLTLAVEENKAEILKLEEKVEQKIKTLEVKIENNIDELRRTMQEMETTQDKKWTEANDKVTTEIKCGDLAKCFAEMIDVKEKCETEVEKMRAETANHFREQDKKIVAQNEQIQQINTKIIVDFNSLKTNLVAVESKQSIQEKITEIHINRNIFQLKNLILFKIPQLTTFDLVAQNHSLPPDFTWKIGGIMNRIKEDKFEKKSELFKWSGYPIQAQAKIKALKGEVYVSLYLKDEEKDVPSNIKVIPNVYYVLRDRSGSSSKHRCETKGYSYGTKFSYSLHFRPYQFNKTWFTDKLYNADDGVEIEMYVEAPAMAQLAFSHDGTLSWAIDSYAKRKQMAKEGLVGYHESPCFYTAPKGYRVQVVMFFNDYGVNEGKGLTAEIHFLTGDFDADLPKNFPHQTTITLFNQKKFDMSIIKECENENTNNISSYSVYLCSNSELETLIENDTLFYNVTIIALETRDT